MKKRIRYSKRCQSKVGIKEKSYGVGFELCLTKKEKKSVDNYLKKHEAHFKKKWKPYNEVDFKVEKVVDLGV
jgi:hypothetical protein